MGDNVYLKNTTTNELMDNRHKSEVRLEDGFRATVFAFRQSFNGIEQGIKHVVDFNAIGISSYGVVAAEHLPKTFAEHVVVPRAQLGLKISKRW